MRDRPHSEAMSEALRADPAYAAELLADVLRESSPAELAIFLQQLTLAFGAHDQTLHV
jgi:DNA-binding phage protein